ncbi:hypothetical protein G647_04512 [Cladophialophora carrionii CBS 160.54]|uniref:AMP-activated protein kinase glycogen-binding domain-containing protein n=1 Tax=Cladophialophora carrionii CBS 160.54 TaxID=1279043 RepID=V9DE64_9EURO|nr:uncharacterized protein G647_04512 [Cladophialophora carrionii CBS 160.54]ETI25140.1 hypothetical protein G647_04512 [Cladophialophora carrionii CBS 160.54]
MGSFLFKWYVKANDVHVTGTFDDWGKSVQLDKVGDIWQKDVELPKADEKILYKFVVNDQWIIDPEAPQEDDGHGNINNVLHPEQIKPKASVVPEAFTTSSAAPESTTAALAGGVPLEPKKEATEVTPASDSHLHGAPGAFPETPANEPDSFGVNPMPPSEGASNPVNVPAGEKIPPLSEVTSNTIHSAVTTSQEAYEKGGAGILGGALAALGLGGTAAKKENLIPESSLPMGENADKSLDASPFISSSGPSTTAADLAAKVPLEDTKAQATTPAVPETVKESIAEAHAEPEATTSSEAVKEKAEVEQELLKKVPENEAAGEHAPNIAATAAAAAAAPASGVPEKVKESIAEAHADPEAATSAEAVKEKSEVEQELLKKVPEHDEAGEPAPTVAAATSATAPAPTGETSSTPAPGQLPTAAAAVADGTDGSAEPSEAPKTTVVPEKTEGDNTEYAPPHAPSAAPGVSNSAAAAVSDGAEDPTLLDEPAVQLGIKNDTEQTTVPSTEAAAAHEATTTEPPKEAAAAAPAAKEEETKAAAPATTTAPTSSATSTPAKKPASTTPSSTPGSAKDKKKKHRVSSFFKKIFD